MKQQESIIIADPMNAHFRAMGWWVQNITPGYIVEDLKRISVMKGLPDAYIGKAGFLPRWVEYKVIRNKRIKFEGSQIKKFKEMHAAGIPVYILCSDHALEKDYRYRMYLYDKVVKEKPNVHYMIGECYELLY